MRKQERRVPGVRGFPARRGLYHSHPKREDIRGFWYNLDNQKHPDHSRKSVFFRQLMCACGCSQSPQKQSPASGRTTGEMSKNLNEWPTIHAGMTAQRTFKDDLYRNRPSFHQQHPAYPLDCSRVYPPVYNSQSMSLKGISSEHAPSPLAPSCECRSTHIDESLLLPFQGIRILQPDGLGKFSLQRPICLEY